MKVSTDDETTSSAARLVSETFISTWRALCVPRRAGAIAAVACPLVGAQAAFGGGALELAIAASMAVVFALVGPALWRLLFPSLLPPPPLPLFVRLAVYGAAGALCVVGLAFGATALFEPRSRFLTSAFSLLISTAFFWVGGFGLGRDIELEDAVAHERARAAALAREAEHARLLALKSHLDPHFIFNTLNAIAEWCRVDGEVAERAILRLSDILRAVLAGVKTTTWPLSRERAILHALTELHLLRDPSLFALTVDVGEGADDVLVPPLLLLPLVENAVKHGPAKGHRGALRIAFQREPGALVVVVENPGPYAGRRAGGEGLATLEARLALLEVRSSLTLTQVLDDTASAGGEGPRTRAVLTLALPEQVS